MRPFGLRALQEVMRGQRLEHGAKLRGDFLVLEPVGIVELLQQLALLLGHRHVVGRPQPFREARHRRQRCEGPQAGKLGGQLRTTCLIRKFPKEIPRRPGWQSLIE